MKKGFTLIELLVVVLIIGILSAVALPQYEKAVEKARLSEALQNTKILRDAIDLFLLENGGYPSTNVCMKDVMTVELQGGEWETEGFCRYNTKIFEYPYSGRCKSDDCYIEILRYREKELYSLTAKKKGDSWEMKCWTQSNPLGRSICKSIESQGYIYTDLDL
jgi:type II secretion system protein G